LSDVPAVSHCVSGPVTFDNLMAMRSAGEAVIERAEGPVLMELEALDGGSSAAVALLMAWYRAAVARDKSVTFHSVPPEVIKIIELSGLADVLPLTAEAAPATPAD
jgi:anti-anti-sigma factor